MGCPHSTRRIVYATPLKTDKKPEGESAIYRNTQAQDRLVTSFKDDPKVNTIQALYQRSFDKFGENPFLGTRSKEGDKYGSYKFKTYNEVKKIAQQIGTALQNFDLAPALKEDNKDYRFVGIWAKNCEQWIEIDIACSFYNIVSVPIYETLGPEIVKFILGQTSLSTIFCSGDHIEQLLEGVESKEYKALRYIVSVDPITSQQREAIKRVKDVKVFEWGKLIESVGDNIKEPMQVNPDDLYTICYTSGTTGTPKGAMLSHKNQTSSIAATLEREDLDISENDSYFSYLPLAHCMERSGILFMISKGMPIGFGTGSKERIMEDVQVMKPTIFFGVPRIYTKIYEGIQKKFAEQGKVKAAFIKMAVQMKLMNLKLCNVYTHPIFDRLIFNKVREGLGGRVRYCATGAAPLDAEVLNFLRVAFCIPIVEGYGPTEGCAITFLTNPGDPANDQVGGPMGCLEYKLVDDKEMKYTVEDKEGPRGEICFRGPCAFSGYYKNEEKTKENLDEDGWVHTGDIGQINKDGSLKVIDKKKSIFKLSQGEYVAGDKVEETYKKNELVEDIFVYGDSSKNYLVSVVVPEKEKIEKLAEQLHVEGDYEEKLKKEELKKKVLEEMDKTAKQGKLNGFEMVKQIYLESKTFQENDLMTPTEKLKRGEAKEKFKDAIDRMYHEGPLSQSRKR